MTELLAAFRQSEAKRFKVKVGVFLLLFQQDNVLLLRRFKTGIADGLYVVPMGGKKEGETPTTSLIREIEEETSLVFDPADISVCHVMHRLHHMPEGLSFEQVDLFFRADSYRGTIQNMEPHKCDELAFYPLDALPVNTENFIRQALTCVQTGDFYSEFGFDA